MPDTYLHTYLLTYLPAYLPTYLPTNLHTYIHTYIHTHTYTHTHRDIHTSFLVTYVHTLHTQVHIFVYVFRYICISLKPLDLDGAERSNTFARLPTAMGTVAPTSCPVPEQVLLETSTGPNFFYLINNDKYSYF